MLDVLAGDDPYLVVDNAPQRKYVETTTDYDDQEGGGSFKTMGWDVVARDCAGNTTTAFTIARPVVTQEDGWTYGYSGVSLTYSGTWKTSTCTCWSADRTRKTSQAGAAVEISREWGAGEPIGLVMEKAPNRGKVRIYVDGVLTEDRRHRLGDRPSTARWSGLPGWRPASTWSGWSTSGPPDGRVSTWTPCSTADRGAATRRGAGVRRTHEAESHACHPGGTVTQLCLRRRTRLVGKPNLGEALGGTS